MDNDRWQSNVNLQDGGTITWPDGHSVEIPPHSNRAYGTIWRNAAFIETLVYTERQPGVVESDRIHLLVTAAGGDPDGWLMNIQDAREVIQALETAIAVAQVLGIPESG